jgi:hypothetical protein
MEKYCQFNEEEILEKIFKEIGTTNKFFVEFGSKIQGTCSNTFHFKELGWIGHWMDAEYVPGAMIERITAENVNEIFKK